MKRRMGVEGLTLVEFMMVMAVLAMVALVLMPGLLKPRVSKLNCINNQKQIAVAFKTWAWDNNDRYPMQVSVTNGGTMEAVSSGVAFVHFQAMSNELSTPKVLFCPAESDRAREIATSFARTNPGGSGFVPFTNDLNLSYFVGVDAAQTRPQMPLLGDHNLATNGVPLRHGLHILATNVLLSWVKPRHNGGGNIGFADGSVQQLTTSALRTSLAGAATNRLAIP